jgi:hypothetical protein
MRGGGSFTEQGMVTNAGVITPHSTFEQTSFTNTHWQILATLVDVYTTVWNFLGSDPTVNFINVQDYNLGFSGFIGSIIDFIGSGGFATNRVLLTGSTNTLTFLGWDVSLDSTSSFHAPGVTGNPVPFTPTITGAGAFAIGNGVRLAEQQKIGARNHVHLQYTFGSTSNEGTGAWTWGGFTASLSPDPGGLSGSRPVGRWWYVKPASAQRASGDVLMAVGGTTVAFQAGGGLPTLGGFTGVGQTVPEAWLNGSFISAEFNYPISV